MNTCPDLADPANGVVTYSLTSGSSNTRPIGTVANFTCNAGYYLQGDGSRVCQNNGTWNELATPICKGKTQCDFIVSETTVFSGSSNHMLGFEWTSKWDD